MAEGVNVTDRERFDRLFARGAPDACWPWKGAKHNAKGYGAFRFRGRLRLAHRVAWALDHGDPPTGMCVCHRCDRPACVNPGHLFLGTYADNNHDRDAKGRAARGRSNARARLTAEAVKSIRERAAVGESTAVLAAEHGVARRTVQYVLAGRQWGHA